MARSLLAFAAVQGAVIGGLVALDVVKKRGRSKCKGFPHPGIFEQAVAGTGLQFKAAVNEAAGRGVDVFLIYDGLANLVVPSSFFRFHPNIHVHRFPVIRTSMLTKTIRSTGLDHRKLLIVDGYIGFVGGYNIGSLYATEEEFSLSGRPNGCRCGCKCDRPNTFGPSGCRLFGNVSVTGRCNSVPWSSAVISSSAPGARWSNADFMGSPEAMLAYADLH